MDIKSENVTTLSIIFMSVEKRASILPKGMISKTVIGSLTTENNMFL